MIEFEKLSLVQSNPATLACNPLESLQIKIDKITKTVCGNLTGKQIMFETIGVKKILMATRIKLFKINIFQYTCKKDFQKQCSRLAVKPDGCACDFKGGDSCLHCCNRYTKKCSSRCSPPDLNDQDCVMYPLKPGCPCDSQNNCAECASKKAFSSSLAICDHCPAGPAPLHCSCEVHECKKPLTCVNGICVPTCTGNKKDSLCHCKNNNECKSGVCKNDVCHKKCYSSVRQPGCPCNGPKFCASGICQDRKCVNKCNKKPLDLDCQCTEHQDCLPGSNCGITTGTCRTAKCDGAKNEVNCPCVDGDICQSGQCSQGVCKCEARGTMYCSCQSDTNCEQGLVCNEFTKSCQPDCSVLPAKRFCPCVAPSYCASNTCSKGKCLDNCAGTAVNCICGASCASHLVCDKGFCVNQCNVENLIGCPCASNSECVSGICLSGKCSDLQVCLKAPRHAGCACKRGGDCMQGTDCNDKICSYPVDDCRFTVRPPSCACRTDTDCASGRCVNGKCRICLGVGRPLNCDCDSPTECDINLRCMNKKCGSDCSKAPYGTGCPCNGHLNCRALLCESGTCSACSFRQGITGCPCSDPASCIQGLACNPATKMCDKDCTAKLKPPGCSCGMNVECASGTCGQNDVCTECITPKFHPGCPCTQNSHCVGECNQVSGVCQKLECASGNTINCACQKPSDCVEDQECLNKICVHSAKTCSRKPLSPSCPCTDSIFCASKYCVKGGCKKCNETARDLNCDCDTSDDCRSPLGCDETSYSCQHDCKQAGSSPGCPCGAPRSCLTLNCAKDSKCDACGNSSAAGCSCKAVNQCGIGLTCQNNVCKQECKSKPLSPSCSCSDSADCASKSCYLDKCGKCSSFPLPPKCVCSQINDCRTTCDPYSGFCADFCDGGVCRQGLNCVDTVKGPVCLSETHCNQQLLPPDCPCHKNNTRPCASERCNDKTEKCEPCTMPASEGCPCASPGQCKSNHLCAMGMFYQICTKMCTVEPYPPTCDCDSDKKCLSGNCASFMCQMCQSGSKLQNCNCQSNSDCPKGLECISGICQQRQCSIYPKYTLNCPCTSAAQCTSGICSLGKCHRGDECAITMGAQGKKKCPPGKVCDDGICVTCFPKKSTGCSCKHPSECPGYCDTITEKCQTSVFCSNATSGNDGCQCECGKPTCKNTCVKIGIFCKCMDCSTVLKSQYCPCKDNTDCESKSCQKSQCVPKIKVCSATRKPPTCPCKEHTDCNDGKCQSNVCVECDDRVPRSLGCPCLEDPHCSDGKCYALLDGSKKCINCATSPNSEGCPCQTGCIRSPQGPVQPGQACTSVVKPPGCQCQRPLECTDGHCVRNPNSKDMICGCKPLGVPGCPCALPSDCLDSCVQSSSGLLICGGDCKGASKKIGCQCTSPTECGKGKCEQTNDDPPAFKCLDCSAGSSPKGCPCSGPLSCKGVCANGKCVDCDTKPLAGKCPCQEDVDCVDKCVGGFCSECSVPQAVNCSCDSSSECESGICAPQSTVGVFKCVAKCTQTAERPVGCSCHENEDCIHTCVGSICTNCDLELKPDTCPCMNDFNCVNKCIDNLCTKTPCLTPPFPHGCSCKAAPDCSSGYCVRTHSGFRKCAECGHTSRDDGCGCESDQDCVNECIWSEDKKICACDCPAGQFCHGTNDHNDPLCVCIAGGSCKSKFGFLDLPTWMFVFMIVLILFFIVLCALLVIWRKKHSKYDFQMMESDVSMGDDYDFRG